MGILKKCKKTDLIFKVRCWRKFSEMDFEKKKIKKYDLIFKVHYRRVDDV